MKRLFSARHLLVVGFLLLAGTLVVIIVGRYTGGSSPVDSPSQGGADLSLSKIDYTETRDGRAFWRLQAARASYDMASGRSSLRDVELSFYGAAQAGTITLVARQGTWDQERGELEVSGDVVATSEDGYRFATERVNYRQRDRLLWTDEAVEISSGQFQIHATGMRFAVDRRHLKLLADVHSKWQLTLPDEEKG